MAEHPLDEGGGPNQKGFHVTMSSAGFHGPPPAPSSTANQRTTPRFGLGSGASSPAEAASDYSPQPHERFRLHPPDDSLPRPFAMRQLRLFLRLFKNKKSKQKKNNENGGKKHADNGEHSGDNFTTIADAHGVSKATLSRKLHAVVSDINKKFMNQEINFPQGNDMVEAVNAFRSIGTRYGQRGLPCVIGAVDGTLLKIRAPKQNEEQFVDRHGNHSINAMAVCGPDMKFSYISARWPGSVADGRVFRNSSLCTQLENGWRPYPNGFLIGDSGYASNIYLLTPYAVDNNQAIRQNYNRVHKGTRRMIECAFGLLKQRFRCLLGTMQLDPSFACQVFICCCILHNLIIDDNDRDAIAQLIGELDGEGQGQDGQNDDINDTASGEIRRSQIAQLLLAV